MTSKKARKRSSEEPAAITPETGVAPDPSIGRPPTYRAEFAKQARKLAAGGFTDAEIADFFDVTPRTLHRWKHDRAGFSVALKRGKEVADDLVEDSLFRSAVGFTRDAVKIFQHEGAPVIVPYVEHHPPSVTAQIFWLKNRRRDQWRDKQEIEHSGNVGLADRLVKARERAGVGPKG